MNPHRIVVVGGGISGLATAFRLSELSRAQGMPISISVLEAQERFGGVIETAVQDEVLYESGPDAFLSEKPWAMALCDRLGIADQLIETNARNRRSFLVQHGRLIPVPAGWYLIAPGRLSTLFGTSLLSWPGKLRMALEPWIPARRDTSDESVGQFIRRRFGQEALERIGQPMIGGIYTADPEQLSLHATMPTLAEMERVHGSVIKALSARRQQSTENTTTASGPRYSLFVTLRGGMQTLIEALSTRLQRDGVILRQRAVVARITRGDVWTIMVNHRETLEADSLCIALPAPQAALLIEPIDPVISQALMTIPYESVATVNCVFRRSDVAHPLDGFGMVVPSLERRSVVGCTFSSVKFPGRAAENSVLLRAFVGGAMHRDIMALDDVAMERVVLEDVRDLLGIRDTPQAVRIRRFSHAMPQYRVGHLDRIAAIEARLRESRGLYLTGNGYRGIGIPDCIHQAEGVAEQMIARVRAISHHTVLAAAPSTVGA